MRGRVTAAILFLILISSPAVPQCNLAPAYSAPFRASFLDVTIEGNDLWAATSYGVALYDRTIDPPKLSASIAVPGVTRVVRVAGGVAYAGSGSSVVLVRKSGNGLTLGASLDAGAVVNDLLFTPVAVYAATANGIVQIDLLDFHQMKLATSGANVTSLALNGTTLYAADSDKSVEVFSIDNASTPVKLGTIDALPRSTSVKFNNSRLYVSDGAQTAIFAGSGVQMTMLATVLAGTTSLAPLANDVAFAAGTDRVVRAIDFTTPSTPVDVFAQEIAPSSGTLNRIFALQRSGSRLYAAGGDLGLLTFDTTSFAAPFPIHSYNAAPSTSVAALGGSIYVSRSTGGIYEYRLSNSGALTEARHWGAGVYKLHDVADNGLLLSSSGNTATVWAVSSTTPGIAATITFPGAFQTAVLIGSKVYALIGATVWTADIANANPTPTAVALNGVRPQWMARAGSSLAVAQETAEETPRTAIYVYSGDVFTNPKTAFVDGVPPAGIAANGNTVALFTFLGLTLVDFNAGTQSVIPGSTSNVALPLGLAFTGNTLLELTDTAVLAWNTTTRTLKRRFVVPSPPIAVHGGTDAQLGLAAVATSNGVASILVSSSTPLPALFPTSTGNSYYDQLAIGGNRLLLFDNRNDVGDLFDLAAEPRWIASIRTPGMIDVAASDSGFFTLTSGGVVTAYSSDGAQLAQRTMNEGSDAQMLAINAVGGAPWVSLLKGCLSGGCSKVTVVLEPKSLVETARLGGGITDVTTSGATAFAITDLPSEIRAINIADPLHPSVIPSRATDGTRAPVSIAERSGTLYVLGDQLYSYSAASLDPTGAQLTFPNDPTASIRIAGDCALISGRLSTTQLYALPSLAPASTNGLPAPPLAAAIRNGAAFIVTDDSLEVWSATAPFAAPARRRPTR
jgi:hypothetical protein